MNPSKLLLVICLFFAFAVSAAAQQKATDLAGSVKEIFRAHCLECHGGSVTRARLKILDNAVVLKRKVVTPGNPAKSVLFELISSKDIEIRMPPAGQPALDAEQINLVRRWIAAGAPPFPVDVIKPAERKREKAFKNIVGVDYVLKEILADVEKLPIADRRFVRYFSLNHVLTSGATADELDNHRAALALAINHLSSEKKLVHPRAVDSPTNTIYAVDVRKPGWHIQPFQILQNGKPVGKSPLNLFDLALLEYPYGIYYPSSDTFDQLLRKYIIPAELARPIPYVRVDWFVSTATQPPLYYDFLQLPLTTDALEKQLGVDAARNLRNKVAVRAGMTVSGVSRNNRVVERHPRAGGAYYWKSFDFRTSKGQENIFRDPVDLNPAGGEMIFNLPNGLQGYFVADAQGVRVDAAPTEIVTDKFASDQTVRNGLSCMRCHDRGMKEFADSVRPALLRLPGAAGLDRNAALDLYPEQKVMQKWVNRDREQFEAALKRMFGKLPGRANFPLVRISKRFLDDPIHLTRAAGELGFRNGQNLEAIFKLPQFVNLGLVPLAGQGVIRRDTWEDHFDQVVENLGLVPMPPVDGLMRAEYPAVGPSVDVKLSSSRKSGVAEPGDEIVLFVANRSNKKVHIELIGASIEGRNTILIPSSTILKPGQTIRLPEKGRLKVGKGRGTEPITLHASDKAFPGGRVLRAEGFRDRVVHPFYAVHRDIGRLILTNDASRITKKTITIETR